MILGKAPEAPEAQVRGLLGHVAQVAQPSWLRVLLGLFLGVFGLGILVPAKAQIVTNSSRTFTIHKNLICKYSSFFRKAFTSNNEEGSDGHINLPDDWPESFELLYGWLRSGQVEVANFYTNGLTSPALF